MKNLPGYGTENFFKWCTSSQLSLLKQLTEAKRCGCWLKLLFAPFHLAGISKQNGNSFSILFFVKFRSQGMRLLLENTVLDSLFVSLTMALCSSLLDNVSKCIIKTRITLKFPARMKKRWKPSIWKKNFHKKLSLNLRYRFHYQYVKDSFRSARIHENIWPISERWINTGFLKRTRFNISNTKDHKNL